MKICDSVQGSDSWYKDRCGIPSASNFKRIITAKTMKLSAQADDYANRMVAERITGNPIEDFGGTGWMERGKELEPEAIRLYEMITGTTVSNCGFCIHDSGMFGCSPDGLVGTEGGVEIKCPMAGTHIGYLDDGVLPDEYFWQVHGGLLTSGYQWWDFMSYHQELPEFKIRVYRDEELLNKLDNAIKELDLIIQRKMQKIQPMLIEA